MRKTMLALGFLLALVPAAAGAISITLAPVVVAGAVGLSFDLDVMVSGLGDGVAPSLGSYDFDISFDPSQLGFESVSFGTQLGAGSLQSSGAALGVVDLAEVSFLSPAELDALQPASFVLATLRFTPIATGTSSIGFTQAIVGDGFGAPLEVSLGGARVVTERAIPEPGALALFALGALAIARASRRS
jgi:hypothetical protein